VIAVAWLPQRTEEFSPDGPIRPTVGAQRVISVDHAHDVQFRNQSPCCAICRGGSWEIVAEIPGKNAAAGPDPAQAEMVAAFAARAAPNVYHP
jgi:hypothetical protein